MYNSIGANLTESYLTGNILDFEIEVAGCNIFRSDRLGSKRGGVVAFIRRDLHCMCGSGHEDPRYSISSNI